ncbi:hypothetical protein HID58_064061 [Brassica napus]|uniref:Uncharacterized protein n=1 Tax=Brassica napus TaxID=3708 RepID=A0ABQ7Z9C0_BRANA|nr:hypothetical protein HID58_064061 [Brassica napus]
MDLKPPDGEIEATATVTTNCFLPASSSPMNNSLSVKSSSLNAEIMMGEAPIQTNTASIVDPLLCDDELSNTPLAITDQSTAITEASSPLHGLNLLHLHRLLLHKHQQRRRVLTRNISTTYLILSGRL